MKAATDRIFSLDRKYEGRGIVYAYLWHVHDDPGLFLVPYDDAVQMLPARSRSRDSWAVRGVWHNGKPGREPTARMEAFEDRFDVLRPAPGA